MQKFTCGYELGATTAAPGVSEAKSWGQEDVERVFFVSCDGGLNSRTEV